MKAYRLQLLRHGMTQGNLDGKYIGVTDLPLCAEGVDELYKKLEDNEYPSVQKVYSSPLKRCVETANIIHPDREIQIVDGLREMDFGDFEGKKAEDIMNTEEYKKYIKGGMDNPPPNGESAESVIQRCYEALHDILGDMMRNGYSYCAVVTHGGLIMNMLSCFGVPKYNPAEISCDFGEGFDIILSADMWQRSCVFEILGRVPMPYEFLNQAEDDENSESIESINIKDLTDED